ncbi:MAG: hypothetical protein NTX82_04315 [Candidatus Parcubacteria bacterium]|nr:hypothetical protein [Candidatus Parcubacteria bacterium]
MLAVFFTEKFDGDCHAGEQSYECLGVYFPETKTVIKMNGTDAIVQKLDNKGVGDFEFLVQLKEVRLERLGSIYKQNLIDIKTLPPDHPLLGLAKDIEDLEQEQSKLDQRKQEVRDAHLKFFLTSKK